MGSLSVPALAIMIFVVVFFVHFCFTNIASCLTAITLAMIGFLVSLHNPDLPIVGIVLGVETMAFRFEDRSDGGIAVIAPESGTTIGVVSAGTDGFIRTNIAPAAEPRRRWAPG